MGLTYRLCFAEFGISAPADETGGLSNLTLLSILHVFVFGI